jgi:hypothetical protein
MVFVGVAVVVVVVGGRGWGERQYTEVLGAKSVVLVEVA